ncbi:MAG: hypothetical protein QOE70_5105 [Chthoniobacter sp.]|jgi:hypothetical protein|nr:hypothetical protein [Chthoniobacter sp.]
MLRCALILGVLVHTGTALLLAGPDSASSKPNPVLATEDRIWSGVVMATNSSSPKDPPPELREFATRLKRVFGYSQFELVGSASNDIGDHGESWLVPSQNFWLGVKARRANAKEARGGYLLNLQLFQDKRPLVDTEAKLAPGCPLFIRGPAYAKGQLIIVLQIERATPVVAGKP